MQIALSLFSPDTVLQSFLEGQTLEICYRKLKALSNLQIYLKSLLTSINGKTIFEDMEWLKNFHWFTVELIHFLYKTFSTLAVKIC